MAEEPRDEHVEQVEQVEVVDGVVVHEAAPIERRSAAPVAKQAAAVAGAGLVAGAGAILLAKGAVRRRANRGTIRLGGRRKGQRLDVVATRTFLVDVHLVDRR
ncbi:MAG TPA: hypothetical protein VFR97_14985 [Capillimicrobium sp.]|nr:hypothetical protein [Capillimicrobium sp.]